MYLTLYPMFVFVLTFLIQTFFITIREIRLKNKLNEVDIEKEYKRNIKIIVKLLIALIISIVLAIISSYVFGMYILVGLREGR